MSDCLCWLNPKARSCERCGRISLDQTRSVTEGLVAKLEEQAADSANGEDAEDEPVENGGEEEEDGEEEDDSEEVRSMTIQPYSPHFSIYRRMSRSSWRIRTRGEVWISGMFMLIQVATSTRSRSLTQRADKTAPVVPGLQVRPSRHLKNVRRICIYPSS